MKSGNRDTTRSRVVENLGSVLITRGNRVGENQAVGRKIDDKIRVEIQRCRNRGITAGGDATINDRLNMSVRLGKSNCDARSTILVRGGFDSQLTFIDGGRSDLNGLTGCDAGPRIDVDRRCDLQNRHPNGKSGGFRIGLGGPLGFFRFGSQFIVHRRSCPDRHGSCGVDRRLGLQFDRCLGVDVIDPHSRAERVLFCRAFIKITFKVSPERLCIRIGSREARDLDISTAADRTGVGCATAGRATAGRATACRAIDECDFRLGLLNNDRHWQSRHLAQDFFGFAAHPRIRIDHILSFELVPRRRRNRDISPTDCCGLVNRDGCICAANPFVNVLCLSPKCPFRIRHGTIGVNSNRSVVRRGRSCSEQLSSGIDLNRG